jgi:hypothetical protein
MGTAALHSGWRRRLAILDSQGHPRAHLERRASPSLWGTTSAGYRRVNAPGQEARFELNFSKLPGIRPQLLDHVRRQRGNATPR